MVRMLLLVLISLGACEGVNASAPAVRQVKRDEPKEALEEIELGMPEKLALAKISWPAATCGDGASSPDWEWYKFAEWFVGDFRIEIRFRHGRVIKKFCEPNKD